MLAVILQQAGLILIAITLAVSCLAVEKNTNAPDIRSTITVGLAEYCPLTCNVDTPSPSGLAIYVLEHAFPSTDYRISYKPQPYMRSISNVQEGRLTAIATTDITPNDKIIFPQKFRINTKACAYTLPESAWAYDPNDFSSLAGVRVGLIRYYADTETEKKIKEMSDEVVYINPGATSVELRMLQMILSGRIDTGFLPSHIANYLIKQHGWHERLRKSGCGNIIYSETIAFSAKLPKSQYYSERLDNAYSALVKNGSFQELLKQYGITEND
jgi:ABC-type amino acid transport substrate-binding protein